MWFRYSEEHSLKSLLSIHYNGIMHPLKIALKSNYNEKWKIEKVIKIITLNLKHITFKKIQILYKNNLYSVFFLNILSVYTQQVFLSIFYWLCYYSCPIFSPLYVLHPVSPPPASPFLSSCPWVIHISSLASSCLTLF